MIQTFYDLIAALFLMGLVAVLGLATMWFAYRANRSLEKSNHKLLQATLVLSQHPAALPMAIQNEETRRAEIDSELKQAQAANGHADPARRPRLQV